VIGDALLDSLSNTRKGLNREWRESPCGRANGEGDSSGGAFAPFAVPGISG
jgi:hypothetical protein